MSEGIRALLAMLVVPADLVLGFYLADRDFKKGKK